MVPVDEHGIMDTAATEISTSGSGTSPGTVYAVVVLDLAGIAPARVVAGFPNVPDAKSYAITKRLADYRVVPMDFPVPLRAPALLPVL
jgi:hypothetical protein